MAIVVLDFDWSLINCNSDTWVVEQLGAMDLMRSLHGTIPWTSLMDRMMTELMARGKTLADIEGCLKMIPLDSAMVRAIKSVAAAGCDLQIISDANTFFIQTVLQNFDVGPYFSQVHTNPAQVDEHGVLKVHPYQSSQHPHGCPLCPPNMCKGLILDNIRTTNAVDLVVYIGDGNGDFCPSLRLKEADHVLARQGFPLAKHLEKNRELLKAQLHEWSSPKEMESCLISILNLDGCSPLPN